MNPEDEVERWLRAAAEREDAPCTRAEELYQRVRRRARPLDAQSKWWLGTYGALSVAGCTLVMRASGLPWTSMAVSFAASAGVAAAMAALGRRMV